MNPSRIHRLEPLGPRGLRIRVHLEAEEAFEVALEALERCGLGVGDRLTADGRKELVDIDAEVRVREVALHLLSFRARTRRELETRLRQKGFSLARVRACLDALEDRGLLDDEAVAAAFVRDRLRHRPRGKSRLVFELRAKGIDPDLAGEAIERVFEDEDVTDAALAREAVESWLARQGATTREALAHERPVPEREKARRRLYGFLARRGFRGDALTGALELADRLARERFEHG